MRCEQHTGPLHNGPQCRNEARWSRPYWNGKSLHVCDEHRHWFISHFEDSSGKWIIGDWKPLERQEELLK